MSLCGTGILTKYEMTSASLQSTERTSSATVKTTTARMSSWFLMIQNGLLCPLNKKSVETKNYNDNDTITITMITLFLSLLYYSYYGKYPYFYS